MLKRQPTQGEPDKSAGWTPLGLYRKRPLVAWSVTVFVIGVIAVAVVALVGGSEPANVTVKCSVYDSDGSVRLTVSGRFTHREAEAGCSGLAASYSGSTGNFWKVGAPPLPSSEPSLACAMKAPGDREAKAIVEENPDSFFSAGAELCSRFSSAGWMQAAQRDGPWQHKYVVALEEEEHAEAEEQEEREYVEGVVERCEQKADATEEDELLSIEHETEERVKAAPESREYAIEDEGWEREEEARERGERAVEACREAEGVAPGETEFR